MAMELDKIVCVGGGRNQIGFADEDDMASDERNAVPSQQSVKAYVDSKVYAENTIDDCTDTDLASPAVNQNLAHDGANWVNKDANVAGVASHDYGGAHADWTLSAVEARCKLLVVTNADEAAAIVGPDTEGKEFYVNNGAGFAVTIKVSGETGVTIANTKTAHVIHNGADYIRVTADA